MRMFFSLAAAALLAGCTAMQDKEIGAVRLVTDAKGRPLKIFMEKSTGNAITDRRVILFTRTTFAKRVPEPLPNHVYRQSVHGVASDHPSTIDIRFFGN
ncbi:hypothetical protein [Allorhizobium taibaishanense]|uniref:Uncharacterized protein n=1 Tax=Allorhizobium taibaishanense TaxID=887144 RepID=A0A1Q8ZZC7_9HYPH|nr:hypothetical protein [Allorhizobium taibaishanense]MBB4007328.1 hypothetical protein [Allorhizobium taibaishanense]OLP47692.1 hypothetical protein BJF91_04715 [Allorhizobium taibaishanense]